MIGLSLLATTFSCKSAQAPQEKQVEANVSKGQSGPAKVVVPTSTEDDDTTMQEMPAPLPPDSLR